MKKSKELSDLLDDDVFASGQSSNDLNTPDTTIHEAVQNETTSQRLQGAISNLATQLEAVKQEVHHVGADYRSIKASLSSATNRSYDTGKLQDVAIEHFKAENASLRERMTSLESKVDTLIMAQKVQCELLAAHRSYFGILEKQLDCSNGPKQYTAPSKIFKQVPVEHPFALGKVCSSGEAARTVPSCDCWKIIKAANEVDTSLSDLVNKKDNWESALDETTTAAREECLQKMQALSRAIAIFSDPIRRFSAVDSLMQDKLHSLYQRTRYKGPDSSMSYQQHCQYVLSQVNGTPCHHADCPTHVPTFRQKKIESVEVDDASSLEE